MAEDLALLSGHALQVVSDAFSVRDQQQCKRRHTIQRSKSGPPFVICNAVE